MEKVFLHIDGDSFFASCEISLDIKLKGKPVVTGKERGIATAMSKEAKALGITRGMPVFQIKKLFPTVIVVSSNYKTYKIFAERMYNIVRRYTPYVEEYSIDECFADITSLIEPYRASEGHYINPLESSKGAKLDLGRQIKETLNTELGMTFSVGIGPTKVLAKIASKHNKPDGLTVIEKSDINGFLKDLPIGAVWGIGPQTTRSIESKGIKTAWQFIEMDKGWIATNFARPYVEIWHELSGESVMDINTGGHDYKSIQQTRTFTPPTKRREDLLVELSKNVEGACIKARRHGLASRRIHYFIKTKEFRYKRKEIILVNPLSNPNDILKEIRKTFDEIFLPNILYRATGVTLADLVSKDHVQDDLFGASYRIDAWGKVFETLDMVDKRYGSSTLMLGSSLNSIKGQKNQNLRGSGQKEKIDKNSRINILKKRLRIPFMGEVT